MNNKLVAIIDSIEKSNMSIEDKTLLIELLQQGKTDHSAFVINFLKASGVALDVLDKFGIDVGDLIDKIF